jgi:predicted extracellular nuclease
MTISFARHLALAVTLFAGSMGLAHAQSCISLNAVDIASTQDFDSLATGGTANALALPGWQLTETGGGARDNELYAAGTGSDNAGDTYSYGAAGATERALGALRSGSLVATFGACFTNNTGAAISALDIAYTGEQWRLGTLARVDRVDFQYSLDAISVITGTWLDVDALDFTSPFTSLVGAVNGNAAGNRTALAATIDGLTIAPGASFWVRWSDADATSADDGLAVDDLQLTPRGEGGGGLPVLTINDVTVTEGTGGITNAAFVVQLSQPAGPGGVTFDLMPVGVTATHGTDFTADALTGVTIAEGVSSFGYVVLVSSDSTAEPDETYQINLSNVDGAIPGDTQGIGTIVNDDFVVTPIHDIQGSGAASPLAGQIVTTAGIVTGRKSNGFFLQASDGEADLDPATSEGVFVFTGTPPAAAAVGNHVRVRGTVIEFVPPQDPGQAPLTEIGGTPTVTLLSSGHALPAAIELTATFPDPAGAIDQLERLEGMRVTVPSFTVAAATQGNTSEPNATGSSNGIFHGVVTGVARPFREPGIQMPDLPPGGGSIPPIPRWDFNPELVTVDSDALSGPGTALNLSTGAVIAHLTGPLDFGFRRYTILRDPTVAIDITAGTDLRAARAPTADEFTVAGYNLERFFDTLNDAGTDDPVLTAVAYQNRLSKASLGIRGYLNTPDILGVIEVEKLPVLQDIANKVNADAVAAGQPDPQYVAYLQEGNDIGGIDVGFLVKTAEAAPGIVRIETLAVTQIGKDTTWIQPDGTPATLNDRPPLQLDAVVHYADGRAFPVTVIVVHQRSLNGAEDDNAGGERVRLKRQRQAEFLADVIQSRQSDAPATRLVVLGDFNAFAFNDGLVDAMNVVTGTPTPDEQTAVAGDGIDLVDPDLVNLGELAPAGERYSFVFDGNAQTLDHVLVNEELVVTTNTSQVDHARINADFPETNRSDANSPSRLADHDPVVAYFAPRPVADLAVAAVAAAPVHVGQVQAFTATVTNHGPEAAQFPGLGFALDAELPTMAVTAPAGWSCDAPQVDAGRTSIACTAATLAKDASAEFTITATTTQAQANQALTLAVAADAQSLDPVPGNDLAEAGVVVIAEADLSVGLAGPAKKLHYGTIERFPVTLRNAGPDAAAQAVVTLRGDAPAANVAIAAPAGWQCAVDGDSANFEAQCSRGDLFDAGASQRFDFAITIPTRSDSAQFLHLTATATAATPELTPANNTAHYVNRIVGVP